MLLEKGTVLQMTKKKVVIGNFISAGAQGEVYNATDIKTNQVGIVKVFFPDFSKDVNTLKRVKSIVSKQIYTFSPVLKCAPQDYYYSSRDHLIAVFSEKAPGIALDDFLTTCDMTLMESLQLAAGLAQGINQLHSKGYSHGDLHSMNIMVYRNNDTIEPFLIDFDNIMMFAKNSFFHDDDTPLLPSSPMLGHELYLSPELRLLQGEDAIPNIESDLFSLAVNIHEILLRSHPASGYDNTQEEFNRAMCNGRWVQDRACANRPSSSTGIPVAVLNTTISSLFRKSFSIIPDERPTAETWVRALCQAMNNVFVCEKCFNQNLIDLDKKICPYCNLPYPVLTLTSIDRKKQWVINQAYIPIGREFFNGDKTISKVHCIFRKLGPETFISSYGLNGTYRKAGTRWIKLPENRAILLKKGDHLKIGGYELHLI